MGYDVTKSNREINSKNLDKRQSLKDIKQITKLRTLVNNIKDYSGSGRHVIPKAFVI